VSKTNKNIFIDITQEGLKKLYVSPQIFYCDFCKSMDVISVDQFPGIIGIFPSTNSKIFYKATIISISWFAWSISSSPVMGRRNGFSNFSIL